MKWQGQRTYGGSGCSSSFQSMSDWLFTITYTISGPSIAYSASSYCTSDSDPTPSETNHAGAGTYGSTTGLVFVSTSTGQIDLSASTAGTYTITYTDTDNQILCV
jgi:hypothetical protein